MLYMPLACIHQRLLNLYKMQRAKWVLSLENMDLHTESKKMKRKVSFFSYQGF